MFNSKIQLQRLAKEGFWIVFGQIAAVMGAIIGVRILTGMLDPNAYGELALAMVVNILISQTIFSPLCAGVLRFYSTALESNDLNRYLNMVLKGLGIVTISLTIISISLATTSLLVFREPEWLGIISLALVLSIASGCNIVLSTVQNAARQRYVVALHQGLDPWLRLLAAYLFMTWFGKTSLMAMAGYLVGAILTLLSQYFFFHRTITNQIFSPTKTGEINWYGKVWSFSWPFTVWGVFTSIQIASDRWALGAFSTTKEVGLYVPLFQLGYYPISLMTGMAMQFLEPIFFQRSGDGSNYQRNASVNRLSWNVTFCALGLTGLSTCITFLFHAQIFQIFVANQYTSTSYLLPLMILSGGIFAAGQTISLNLMSQIKTRRIMFIKIFTATLGVLLNMIGAYLNGTIGVVIASVLFSSSYFLLIVIFSKY